MQQIIRSQFGHFAVIGLLNTAIDTLAYIGLVALGWPVWMAIVLSTSVGLFCSFVLNRRFTFGTGDKVVSKAALQFMVEALIGLWLLQPAIVTLLSHLFWADKRIPANGCQAIGDRSDADLELRLVPAVRLPAGRVILFTAYK